MLINAQQEPERNADTAWILQSWITATALDGTPRPAIAGRSDAPERVAKPDDGVAVLVRYILRTTRRPDLSPTACTDFGGLADPRFAGHPERNERHYRPHLQ